MYAKKDFDDLDLWKKYSKRYSDPSFLVMGTLKYLILDIWHQ